MLDIDYEAILQRAPTELSHAEQITKCANCAVECSIYNIFWYILIVYWFRYIRPIWMTLKCNCTATLETKVMNTELSVHALFSPFILISLHILKHNHRTMDTKWDVLLHFFSIVLTLFEAIDFYLHCFFSIKNILYSAFQ